MKRTRGKFFW